MADTKVSALASGSPAVSTDLLLIARSGANYKLTLAQLLTSPTLTTPVLGAATGTSLVLSGGAFQTPASGRGRFYGNTVEGGVVAGKGLSYDVCLVNGDGDYVMRNFTATRKVQFGSLMADSGDLVQVNGSFYSSGAITTNGGLQTFGANDSGGAGYRMVRVPNT